MVQKAIEGNPHFELSLIEMNEDGYTYTVSDSGAAETAKSGHRLLLYYRRRLSL